MMSSPSSSSSKKTGTEGIYNGPLTDTFTPPASCNYLSLFSSRPRFQTVSRDIISSRKTVSTATTTITRQRTELWKFSYETDPACFPPDHGTSKSVYYSPGVCPKDWVGARTRSTGAETTIFCCPESFAVNVDDGAVEPQCLSTVVAKTTTNVIIYRNSTRINEEPTNTQINSQLVSADGIQVRFHPGDLDETATSSPVPSPSGSSGLSTGAKIGIGVGVPLAVIALAALGFIIFWRRRRQNKALAGPSPYNAEDEAKNGNLAVAQYPDNSPPRLAELDSQGVPVLGGNGIGGGNTLNKNSAVAHEMAQPEVVHEVSGDNTWRSGTGPLPDPAELYPAPVAKPSQPS